MGERWVGWLGKSLHCCTANKNNKNFSLFVWSLQWYSTVVCKMQKKLRFGSCSSRMLCSNKSRPQFPKSAIASFTTQLQVYNSVLCWRRHDVTTLSIRTLTGCIACRSRLTNSAARVLTCDYNLGLSGRSPRPPTPQWIPMKSYATSRTPRANNTQYSAPISPQPSPLSIALRIGLYVRHSP